MSPQSSQSNKSSAKKQIIPTRAAGARAFDNPADELFAAAFGESPNSEVSESNNLLPKNDRHDKNLARFDNRIKRSLLRQIKEFCLKFDITQKEFVEMAAIEFIKDWDQKLDQLNANVGDSFKPTLWQSKPELMNLYRVYNAENKWKLRDDEVAKFYNETDIRLIELGIIETQFNAGFKKINSFSYYKNQIDNFIEQKLSAEMLDFLIAHYRDKWRIATNKSI